jgi:hypothetical protein
MSLIGNSALLIGAVALFIHFFRSRLPDPNHISPELPLITTDVSQWALLVQHYNTAFFSHPFVADVAHEMERPTRSRTVALPCIANTLCALVTFVIPLVGYLSGTECPLADLIFLYFDPLAPEVVIGKVAVLTVSLMSSAVFGWELARQVSNMVVPGSDDNKYTVSLAGLAVICAYVAIHMVDGKPRIAIFSIGNIGFSILAFVLPPLYYILQFKTASVRWLMLALIVFAIGVALSIFTAIALGHRLAA